MDSMNGPYGLSSTSFRVDWRRLDLREAGKAGESVQRLAMLAILSSLSGELRARGYEVSIPKLVKGAPMAYFNCTLHLLKPDICLTASGSTDPFIDCKLEPLGWRRTWKTPPYHEIWQEWEQLRGVIDEHLTKTLHIEPLRWERPRAYRAPSA
jgi:hypothetical protein